MFAQGEHNRKEKVRHVRIILPSPARPDRISTNEEGRDLQNHDLGCETWLSDSEALDLRNLPYPTVSKKAVERAGKVIARRHDYTGDLPLELIEAFRVAHDWRASHAYPMHIERLRLSGMARAFSAPVSASRLKRMASIRKKLGRIPVGLDRFQDLGGCRVVFNSMVDLRDFERGYMREHGHRLVRTTDYILAPKVGGYRSNHLIVNPACKGDRAVHNKQRLEIQLRTRLQHVWATAGEAIGAMRDEDIKAGEGCPKWLRLLELMSVEIAQREGGPLGALGEVDQALRCEELRALESELDAINTLRHYTVAVDGQQSAEWERSQYFLIVLDTVAGTVRVRPQTKFLSGQIDGYGDARETVQTALVSVDRADALVAAYPNFFLDVTEFNSLLKEAVGASCQLPARPESSIDRLDLSFLRGLR